MDKLSLPRGLVRYDTELNQKLSEKNRENKINIWRKRTIFYISILLITSSIMFYGLSSRSPIELHVLHDRNPLFVQLKDHKIRNGYDIKILNKTHEDKVYKLSVSGIDRPEIRIMGAGNISPDNLIVFADSVGHFRVFLTSYKQMFLRQKLIFYVEDVKTKIKQHKNSIFLSGKE
jgi:polyferredoxin